MARETNGFTLVELMATLAVLACLLSIGLPAVANIRKLAQANTAFHLLTASLATARITAVTRNRAVSVCPSHDGTACRRDLNWDEGWIVYLDPQRGRQPPNDDAILQRVVAARGVTIRSTAGRHLVRYLPDGRSSGSNVSLSLCSATAKELMGRVIVNNAGRARSERPTKSIDCPYTP